MRRWVAVAVLVAGLVLGATTANAASTISFARPIPVKHSGIAPIRSWGGASCPSARLCVATDGTPLILTSTNPIGGRRAWTLGTIGSFGFIADIACPSTSLCVATGGDSGLDGFYTSTDPAGGAATWSFSETDLGSLISGVSCASVSLCVAVDQSGDIFTSTDPAGGAGTWSFGTIDPDGSDLTGVSCPSARLCVAVDLDGAIFASTNPAGGPATWYRTRRRGGRKRGWFDVSCPNVRLCVASGSGLGVSTDPARPAKLAPHPRTCERRSDQGHNRDLMRLAASVRGRRPVRAGVRVDRPPRWRPRVARDPGAPTHAGGRECEGRVLALARAGMCRRGHRQRMAGRRTCPSGSPPPRSLTSYVPLSPSSRG